MDCKGYHSTRDALSWGLVSLLAPYPAPGPGPSLNRALDPCSYPCSCPLVFEVVAVVHTGGYTVLGAGGPSEIYTQILAILKCDLYITQGHILHFNTLGSGSLDVVFVM